MFELEVVYRRFFQFWLIFLNQIISHAQKNITSTDTGIAHFVWRRKIPRIRKISQNIRNNNEGPW